MKKRFIIQLFILIQVVSSFAQTRYYVNHSATAANTGQTWEDAYTDLHQALNIALAGDEIWVAEGTYFPTTTTDRNISFEPKSGVKFFGGFAGNEVDLGQRDWLTHATFLSGDIGISGDSTDNSFNLLYLFQPDSNTIIDGFTICHGMADYVNGAGSVRDRVICGAGLFIEAGTWNAFPNVQNCRFWRNTANSFGGAVMVNGASAGSVAPRFVNCRFDENHCLGSGGGLARFGGSWVERGNELEGCHFSQNYAGLHGGGLFYSDTKGLNTVSLQYCSFVGNSAANNGGGAYFSTGKVGKSGLYIQECAFEANRALGGAAIMIFTNGNDFDGLLVIDKSQFLKNISPLGVTGSSIISADQFSTPQSVVKFSNSIFKENFAVNEILSFSWVYARMIIENLLFEKNASGKILSQSDLQSSEINNTIFRLNDCASIGGQSFYGNNTSLSLSNCLFEKNRTVNASGLFTANLERLTVRNCAFLYENHPVGFNPFIASGCDSFLLFNSIITDSLTKWSFAGGQDYAFLAHNSFGFIDCNDQLPNVICGPNNLYGLDPMFRDPANHDYSLLPCSPLINAGSNLAAANLLTDLAGNPRIQGGTVDIGAYESPSFTLATEPSIKPACVGAANGSISLDPVFGCEPYTYQWLPQVGNGPALDGLAPGTYQLTLTDGRGQQILDTFQVAAAALPELSPTATDVQCSTGLGGSISAGVSQGTAPYHLQWSPAAADTSYLGQLAPGNYALTVTDANGCQDSASTSIALLGMISLQINGLAIPCNGQTGWLSATPVTGAAPFTWAWSAWSGTDSLAQPLGPGQYAVTVTDAYGCTASNTFPPMTEPSLITATIGTNPQTNLNTPNGTAVVTTTSGGSPAFPPASPYEYSWSTGGMDHFIAGLTAGNYTVTISDRNGCTTVVEVLVDLLVGTEAPEAQVVLMYPNPAVDWVRVVLPEGRGAYAVTLLDESGRVLQTIAIPRGQAFAHLDLKDLPAGGYWLRVEGTEGEMFKLIKQAN